MRPTLSVTSCSKTFFHIDMLNGGDVLHGGCAAYLIGWCVSLLYDAGVLLFTAILSSCSTLPTAALDFATGGTGKVGMSQAVTVTYHAPATL